MLPLVSRSRRALLAAAPPRREVQLGAALLGAQPRAPPRLQPRHHRVPDQGPELRLHLRRGLGHHTRGEDCLDTVMTSLCRPTQGGPRLRVPPLPGPKPRLGGGRVEVAVPGVPGKCLDVYISLHMTWLLHEGIFHVGGLIKPAIFGSLPWAYVMCNLAEILICGRH